MRKILFWLAIVPGMYAFILSLSGCGKVSGPISPLVNPTTILFNFDNGTADGWQYDSCNPSTFNGLPVTATFAGLPVTVVPTPSATNQIAFQGTGALYLPIPEFGQVQVVKSGPITETDYVSLTSYSVHYQFASAVDMTNKIFSMWVYWKSGVVTPPNQIGAQIFIKDSSWQYANGTFFNLTQNQWTQVTYNVKAPNYQANPPPDLTKIMQVGLQIAGSGSAVFTSDGEVDADSFGY